jgi:hypothetical protein
MKKCVLSAIAFTALIFFNACTKQSENPPPPLSDYFPLQTGKYITYDLDSLVFINFGAKDTIIHYQVQYYTDSTLIDNLGRTAYRIVRSIRNTPSDPWQADNTFMAVNNGNRIEWVENNLRFIKLTEPVEAGFSWNGNSFIDTYTIYSDVPYLDPSNGWNYVYDSMNVPMILNGITIDSTIKVDEVNDTVGLPNNPNSYSQITYSAENYAKGIGLVYRNFLYQQYQNPVNGIPGFYQGFGVTLTMIDHN